MVCKAIQNADRFQSIKLQPLQFQTRIRHLAEDPRYAETVRSLSLIALLKLPKVTYDQNDSEQQFLKTANPLADFRIM